MTTKRNTLGAAPELSGLWGGAGHKEESVY